MEGKTQETAAAKAGMSVRSARKWQSGPLTVAGETGASVAHSADPFDSRCCGMIRRQLKGQLHWLHLDGQDRRPDHFPPGREAPWELGIAGQSYPHPFDTATLLRRGRRRPSGSIAECPHGRRRWCDNTSVPPTNCAAPLNDNAVRRPAGPLLRSTRRHENGVRHRPGPHPAGSQSCCRPERCRNSQLRQVPVVPT